MKTQRTLYISRLKITFQLNYVNQMYVSVNAIFYVNIKAKIITESFNGAQKICQIEKNCNIID